jgi:hypothetical protein
MPTNPTLQRRNPAAVKQHTPFAIDSTEFLLVLPLPQQNPPPNVAAGRAVRFLLLRHFPPAAPCAFCSRRACLPDYRWRRRFVAESSPVCPVPADPTPPLLWPRMYHSSPSNATLYMAEAPLPPACHCDSIYICALVEAVPMHSTAIGPCLTRGPCFPPHPVRDVSPFMPAAVDPGPAAAVGLATLHQRGWSGGLMETMNCTGRGGSVS